MPVNHALAPLSLTYFLRQAAFSSESKSNRFCSRRKEADMWIFMVFMGIATQVLGP
jgi:hypothetical protein